jgi:amino acid transporter
MSQTSPTSPTTTQGIRPGRLKGGAIGALGAAVMAMAFMGPATSVAFNTPPAAAKIGFALPFGILLAMIVCLITASTIGSFSSKLPSAGFAYTFNTHAYGKGTGFTSGWILALAYGAVGPMLFAAMGGFGSQFISTQFHVTVQWWIISAFIMAVIWFIGSRGISSSAKTALIFLTLEVGVLLGLFATIIGKGGANGNTIAAFNPAHSLNGISGIGFGMLWGVLMFVGFESAGTLGEETRDPRRSVPRALFFAVILIGIVYVVSGYAAAIGFGEQHVSALASSTSPWSTLANTYWGTQVAWVLTLTVLNSQFANVLSGSSAAVRIIFSLGREGILSRKLGTTSRRDNPVTAWAAYILFAAVVTFALGAWITPFGAYNFLGSILGLGIIVLYILMNIGLVVYFRRRHPAEFSPVRHALLPIAGSLLLLLPIYGQLWPIPAWHYDVVPYLIVAWIIGGVGYFLYLKSRRPAMVEAMGRVWEPDPGRADTAAATPAGTGEPAP